MKTYAHTYVDIGDVCRYNNLDVGEVMEAVNHSDISFGTNFDTLISQDQLQSALDDYFDLDKQVVLDFGKLDDTIVISLGS